MTHKEIATRLNDALRQRDRADLTQAIKALRDELDPPKPVSGTMVWWRYKGAGGQWKLGQAITAGVLEFGEEGVIIWGQIDYKPARILAPDEVAVKVPPVSEWRGGCYYAAWMDAGEAIDPVVIMTRAEAERMEATER